MSISDSESQKVFPMEIDKDQLRQQFAKEWQKHYKLECLEKRGFRRRKCGKCSRNFWSMEERRLCGDPGCTGYKFIGDTPVRKRLGYIDTWKVIEKYFTSHKHGYVKPFPTVARWRDDLYFTIASINDFQPYVVTGELDPPANPVIVPQPCIRFSDVSNVGVSGRHYTNFVMVGQLSFNNKKTGLFYWKNEAIEHDIAYLKQLGIPEGEIIFMEDVWNGGGNFGPSMEYFVRGLELGNCVFMQYEVTETGPRELKTRVIDMGAGLSRLAWITTGDPTSYEVVFGNVISKMKRDNNIEIDHNLFLKFAKISGSLNEDEVPDLEAEKARIAGMLGISKEELFKTLEPLHALYASADHLLTLLFTVTDGMLPSNAGGGYNLRMVLRRVFGFEEEFRLSLNFEEILKGHAAHLSYMFPHLEGGVNTTLAVIDEERRKYLATKEKATAIVTNLVKKAKTAGAAAEHAPLKERNGKGARISANELLVLYKSNGIPPEHILEIARENGIEVKMPGNFYRMVKEKEEDVGEKTQPKTDVANLPKTGVLYYTVATEFDAKVLATTDRYVVLDRTAFYPEGGGQLGDTGRLDGVAVAGTIKESGVVLHEVADPRKFREGQKVHGVVDAGRRKTITRHHTVTHLVTAACRQILGRHIWQAGSYKDAEKAHLDVTHYRKITQEELNLIELKVNEFILANLPITIEVLPRTEAERKYGFTLYQGGAVPGKELRVVSIGNVDSEACGGTHHMLKGSAEIGCFKIIRRESIQDGIERITYKCGDVAIRYVQEKEAILRDAAARISVNDSELPRAVERFFSEWKEQRKKLEAMGEELIREEAAGIIEHSKGRVLVKILDMDDSMLKKLAGKVADSENSAAVLINKQGSILCTVGRNSTYKANELLKKVVEKLGGNGGGNAQMASGKAKHVGLVTID